MAEQSKLDNLLSRRFSDQSIAKLGLDLKGMKNILLSLFIFFSLLSQAQKSTEYIDTVDIVDFLESVYKKEPTFYLENEFGFKEYRLEGKVVTFKERAEVKSKEIVRKNGEIIDNQYIEFRSLDQILKKRLDTSDTSKLVFDNAIIIDKNIFLQDYLIAVSKVGNRVQSSFNMRNFSFENMKFTSLNFYGNKFKNNYKKRYENSFENSVNPFLNLQFKDCEFDFGLNISQDSSDLEIEHCKSNILTVSSFKYSNALSVSESNLGKLFINSHSSKLSLIEEIHLINNKIEPNSNKPYQNNDTLYVTDLNGNGLIRLGDKSNSLTRYRTLRYLKSNVKKEDILSLDSVSQEIGDINVSGAKQVVIQNNQFGVENCDHVSIDGVCEELKIQENTFSGRCILKGLIINEKFTFHSNSLKGLVLNEFKFPEIQNFIHWNFQLNSFKLLFEPIIFDTKRDSSFTVQNEVTQKNWTYNLRDSRIKTQLYYVPAKSNLIIQDYVTYLKAKKIYRKLLQLFKEQGDLESSNSCYAEMKQVETAHWKYLYSQNPSFETYFRWKLNQFLNYFTDYGTNPAKAVIKSIWVILIFAIFYLFFPSDWDITNRAEFLKRWKSLLSSKRKAERSRNAAADSSTKLRVTAFFSTLGFLLYTGFIHILNALTLSLNAFTTLGFGDIPTRGAARYVTIVQGFIGWFLLTIFSVSLINQVLG